MKNKNVKSINALKAHEALKGCPQIVRDYVRALERAKNNWHELQIKTARELRRAKIEIENLKRNTNK